MWTLIANVKTRNVFHGIQLDTCPGQTIIIRIGNCGMVTLRPWTTHIGKRRNPALTRLHWNQLTQFLRLPSQHLPFRSRIARTFRRTNQNKLALWRPFKSNPFSTPRALHHRLRRTWHRQVRRPTQTAVSRCDVDTALLAVQQLPTIVANFAVRRLAHIAHRGTRWYRDNLRRKNGIIKRRL